MSKLRFAMVFFLGYLLATVIFAISFEIDKLQTMHKLETDQIKDTVGQYCSALYIEEEEKKEYKIQKGPATNNSTVDTQIYYLKIK